MTCPNENSLARLLDARLSDTERTAVERHLDVCTDCSHLVSELAVLVAPPDADAGRYRLRGEIARGGMGRVVEATDPVLGRVVAVKEALSEDDEVVRRFVRETRITARLEHPSIVPVYDAGTAADGTPYYVMRKVSGKPLAELVEKARTVPDRLALIPNVLAAAHAMAHAHQRGIVHRDLKPSNILVGDNGETVVIDWGLAKVIGELDDHHAAAEVDPSGSLRTRIGAVFGTPGFIAPEQLRGQAVDARGDVYALGATLYYVLGRRPPHAGKSEDDMMEAALAGPPTPITEHVEGVPRELAAIVDKALAFEEAERYVDASALADDLQRFLTGQLISAHRYSPRERFVRFVRRHRGAVAIASIATVAMAIGAAVAITNIVHERDRADRQAVLATDHARDAEQRADDLIVLQADTLVKTNPTAAVALVKQLRWPPDRWQRMWRAARGVAAGARSQGVAWAMPAPDGFVSPSMSRSGQRAAATSRDGEVWIYDLPRHHAQRLDVRSPQRRAIFADDGHVIVFEKTRAMVVELSSGAQRVFGDVSDVGELAVVSNALVWSSKHTFFRTDFATGATSTIAKASQNWFAVSPDLKTLALIGERSILIVDLETRASHSIASIVQPIFVAWAADSDHLAITTNARIGSALRRDAAISWGPPGPSNQTLQPVFAGQQLYLGSSTLDILDPDGVYPVIGAIDLGVGMALGFNSYVIVASNGILHAVGRGWNVELDPPASAIHSIIAVPDGPFVVGASSGRVFVWDLRDLLPKPHPITNSTYSAPIGGHDLLLWHDMTLAAWLDTDTWRSAPEVAIPAASVVDSRADLGVAIADHVTPSPSYVVTKDRAELLDGDTVAAVIRGTNEIVFATRKGELALYDVKSRKRVALFHRDAEVESIHARGRWVAAAYANGLVVRHDLESGAETELHLAAHQITVLDDGRVCSPIELRIACWKLDGTVVTAFTLPEPAGVVALGPERMIVATKASVYTADFANDRLVPVLPVDPERSISAAADYGVVIAGYGQIDEVDLTTGQRWQVVQGGVRRIRTLTLSPDATTVFGMIEGFGGGLEIAIWNAGLPSDADATARWLDQLTNASATAGVGSLAWP